MTEYVPADVESIGIEQRTERALSECMTVLPEGGDIYTVVGENGGTYRVDLREQRCTCPDHKHRGEWCKHGRRVEFATGERSPPADVEGIDEHLGEHIDGGVRCVVADGGLPEYLTRLPTIVGDDVYHCQTCGGEGDTPDGVTHHEECPEVAADGVAPDGGLVGVTTSAGDGAKGAHEDYTRVPLAGGVLVYEEQDLGRELVGFEDVDDWSALAEGLAARGHGRGAMHHLPVLDEEGTA